ncbi:MAG: pilus assembly protein TadG-related protein [Pseudomonadota bacterium]
MTFDSKSVWAEVAQKRRAFVSSEDGSLIIFALFTLVAMLLCVGVGLDTMRYEVQRTIYQGTADRAVLAAADLDVTNDPLRSPEDVVYDYFRRGGLPSTLANVDVQDVGGGNAVSVETTVQVPTLLLRMVGFEDLQGPAPSTATETITDVEVALVLDNSGSMGSGTKMADLKSAAKQFVEDVVKDDLSEGTVAISVVPFATQVNPGALGGYLTTSGEHEHSSCVTFETAHFAEHALSATATHSQTAHFQPNHDKKDPADITMVCPPVESREITPWSSDKTHLKARIDAMEPWGWTSIELGTKWGLALLDPASRTISSDMLAKGQLSNQVAGMPFDYGRPDTEKYLIVMSDGANTTQWDVKPGYRSGASPVWVEADGTYYYLHAEDGLYYQESSGDTLTTLDASATNLTWVEVWDQMTVKYFVNKLKNKAVSGDWQTLYNEIVDTIGSSVKNTRTSAICQAARDEGITVFTIGVGTYGQGDATLLDCAGTPANFFDIAADEMDQAFGAIARQINQLRLTH